MHGQTLGLHCLLETAWYAMQSLHSSQVILLYCKWYLFFFISRQYLAIVPLEIDFIVLLYKYKYVLLYNINDILFRLPKLTYFYSIDSNEVHELDCNKSIESNKSLSDSIEHSYF